MRKRIIFLATIMVAMVCTFSSCANKEVKVILLAGQSNMAGRGIYAELSDGDKDRIEKVSNRVMVSTQGRVAQPLSYSESNKHLKEFGPELFIGVALAEAYPETEFLLVKRAVGGTSLHGAWSPDWSQEKSNISEFSADRKKMKLYYEHVEYIHQNLKLLEDQGKQYKIAGMAWMQGEKDTRLEVSAINYEKNLKRLIEAYRAEFKVEDMPFVFGQVNNPARKRDYQKGTDTVRKAMEYVIKSVKKVEMIATSRDTSWSDFPKLDDNVHYNADGQKRLGTAMGKALTRIMY